MLTSKQFSRLLCFFVFFLSTVHITAQDPQGTVLLPGTYEIDTITIRARIRLVDPVAKPYTETVSLFPTISNVRRSDIRNQGARTLIDAVSFIPGGFTETREGR